MAEERFPEAESRQEYVPSVSGYCLFKSNREPGDSDIVAAHPSKIAKDGAPTLSARSTKTKMKHGAPGRSFLRHYSCASASQHRLPVATQSAAALRRGRRHS